MPTLNTLFILRTQKSSWKAMLDSHRTSSVQFLLRVTIRVSRITKRRYGEEQTGSTRVNCLYRPTGDPGRSRPDLQQSTVSIDKQEIRGGADRIYNSQLSLKTNRRSGEEQTGSTTVNCLYRQTGDPGRSRPDLQQSTVSIDKQEIRGGADRIYNSQLYL